ncbi:prepilin-type N-terminal cleavage/methylation domain-containing protein [Azoarcus sp. KH32C]|uniref:prepilin-type N-terminal cleavage/methylation domain-containing protein n=1 Tax=Azoarcus sp. KH32C TaxID=748247 RepID=UPI0002386EFD|nr:prepilin-type N-terminal cleavage/methylation domain-containing protein [Azoarcus sp. KH32C]BAL25517.1 hypothetical protein AZKH_3228 [Azoarcus sp. KH32C]
MLNPSKATQRGFSLIELMVGITVGLFVMAAVGSFFVDYLSSNRQMIQIARLDQELRAATDILVRDLKRAGYKQDIHMDILNLSQSSTSRAATMPILDSGETVITGSQLEFWYDENSDNTLNTASNTEEHGYRVSGNALQRYAGNSGWQNVTDPSVIQISGLTITRTYHCIDIDGSTGPATCAGTPIAPSASDDGAYFVTEIRLALTGSLPSTAITRTLNERVRIRADIYRDGPGGSSTY